jgi:hypothetical protein
MENQTETTTHTTTEINKKQPYLEGGITGKGFKKGKSGNLKGRPPETEEQKIIKKAQREMVAEYKEKLAEALIDISPILIKKAMDGDIIAIKEINDIVVGKAPSLNENRNLNLNIEISPEDQEKINKALDEVL